MYRECGGAVYLVVPRAPVAQLGAKLAERKRPQLHLNKQRCVNRTVPRRGIVLTR